MPPKPIILYEGAEDKAFLAELLRVFGFIEKFNFHPESVGKDGFEKILKGLVAGRENAIIIVADNDGNPTRAFADIQRQIGAAGFTIPQREREIAETPNMPSLSVLMIPWDNDQGCLETLCLSGANTKYKDQLDCADALVKCAGADTWDIAKKSKLRMRGFLSAVCKSDPNTGLRYAWTTNGGRPGDIFPLNNQSFKPIADFFAALPWIT